MTTMLAPSIKSFVQKQLSGIDSEEQSEYGLGDHRLLLPPPPPAREEDAVLEPLAALGVTAPVVLTLAVLLDSRLKEDSGIVELWLPHLRIEAKLRDEKNTNSERGVPGASREGVLGVEPLSDGVERVRRRRRHSHR